jgi:hypothetical protein
LGRTDLMAIAQDPAGNKEQMASGRRKPGSRGVKEEEVRGGAG